MYRKYRVDEKIEVGDCITLECMLNNAFRGMIITRIHDRLVTVARPHMRITDYGGVYTGIETFTESLTGIRQNWLVFTCDSKNNRKDSRTF